MCHVVISIQRQLLEGTSSLPFSHGSELYPGAVECHQSCDTVYKARFITRKNDWGFSSFQLGFSFSLCKFAHPSFIHAPAQSPECGTAALPQGCCPSVGQHCVPPWPHCLASWSPKETAAFSFPIPFSSDVQTLLTSVLLAGDPLWHPVRCWAAGQLPAQDLFTLHFPLPFFFFCEDAAASLPC